MVGAAWRERRHIIFVFALLTWMRPSEFFGVQYPDPALDFTGSTERGICRIRPAVV